MSALVSVEAAAELLDTSRASLMVTACAYKRDRGMYPKWYVSNGKRGASKSYVDMDILARNRQLVRSMWLHSTDSFYWILSEHFGMSDGEIARQLAKRSEKFRTASSWRTFLHKILFCLPPETVYSLSSDMQSEFFRLSKRIIALAYKES